MKVIICDNRTEFKNRVMNQFCKIKGIKRGFSVARTPQQNEVAERKNRTLIEAARTMLADSKLPTTFWAKVVNTVCYVQNRLFVIKPHNKAHYKLFLGRKPALSFMRPFGCLVTILNTIDHLGKFDGKADEGFFVGYSTNSKAFRVFNSRTRIVEENLHVQFSENTPNIAGSGPNWLFDIDALTNSMNYKPVVAGNQSNGNAGTKACADAGKARVETVPSKDYILLPLWTQDPPFSSSPQGCPDVGSQPSEEEKKDAEDPGNEGGNPSEEGERINQEKDASVNSTNNINTVSPTVNAASIEDNAVDENIVYGCADDPNIPDLEEISRFCDAENDDSGTDINNLDTYFQVSHVPTTIIHKDHPLNQVIGDLQSATQTRQMKKNLEEYEFVKEPKKVVQALKDLSWIEAMQKELLQFKLQEVWTLVELPNGKRAIGTKWVFRNKKDERGIVIKNKARLVAQWYTQEKGIDYDEVFAPLAKIEAIRLFLAYASFKDFVVYQIDVKRDFLYGKIKEEVYVCQPPQTSLTEFQRGQIDKTLFIMRDQGDILIVQVYVDDIILGSTKKKLCTKFEKMMHKKFQMSFMGELTFFLGLDVKTVSTPIETHKPLLKDADGEDIDEHMYRSMIGSLMYLTSSRPDIIYLKGQPKLGLWYPKDSPFDLVAYIDSDYAGASLDRKSTTKAEYVAASSCSALDLKSIDGLWHIEIRHHFIRDSNEKKLIQMIKIHTNKNVADLLTKAFDVKTINGKVQLQALVDGKKIIITESTIRRYLQLEDAKGIDCLPNVAIFEQLTFMGYEKLSQKLTFYRAFFSSQWKFLIHTILQYLSVKTTAWNEFSSTMASAIICLAINQKFNFSKYIFDSMVKNVNKFLMYLRSVQMFVNQQVGDMSNHKRIYVTPSHTKKVFGNMKREGKGFSRRVTLLFPTMMVQAQQEQGKGLANPTDPQHTPTIAQPSSSQPQKKHKPRKPKKKDTQIPQSSVLVTI
ncbi:putative ribonuclease H-like domain-containing protein [Tanacetum coccineum]